MPWTSVGNLIQAAVWCPGVLDQLQPSDQLQSTAPPLMSALVICYSLIDDDEEEGEEEGEEEEEEEEEKRRLWAWWPWKDLWASLLILILQFTKLIIFLKCNVM